MSGIQNACRLVYPIDEDDGDVRRCGFAYGTLPGHGERGEERFTVEWRQADDSVIYDLYAFSRPNHLLAMIGNPLVRRLQRRFALDSMRTMVRAVAWEISAATDAADRRSLWIAVSRGRQRTGR